MKRAVLVAITALSVVLAGCGGITKSSQASSAGSPSPVGSSNPTGSTSQAASAAAPSVGKLTLRIVSVGAKETNTGQPTIKWADELQQMSNGQITVDAHYGDLGGDTDLLKQVREGAIDGFMASTDTISTLDQKFNLYGLPFLFANYKQAYAVADGDIGQQLLQELDQYGIKALGYTDLGFRNFASTGRPIGTPADLKGLKMRSLPGAIPNSMWTALGATPVTLGGSEIYPGLQQHAVDGLDMPVGFMVTAKLFEVTKYYSLSRHAFTAEAFIIGGNRWKSFTPAQQDVISKATQATAQWARQYDQDLENQGLDQLKQKGLQVSDVPNIKAFQDAMTPVYDQAAKLVGADLLAKVRSVTSSAR